MESAAQTSPTLRWWIGGILFASTAINYVDRQTLFLLAPYLRFATELINAMPEAAAPRKNCRRVFDPSVCCMERSGGRNLEKRLDHRDFLMSMAGEKRPAHGTRVIH